MNKKLQEIASFLRLERLRNDRRIVIFMICLIIATILWFLNALSQDYSTTLSYPVRYTNPPENLFLSNDPPKRLEIEVSAHGFTLLRHKLSFSVSPIVLDLTSITNEDELVNTNITVRTESLIRQISDQVSNEVIVNGVEPETILFAFDSLATKKIPVTADITLNFESQFFLNGIVSVEPDSVEITGPTSILDTTYVLQTRRRNFENLDTEVNAAVNVIHPDKTEVDPEKVNLTIPVERFTEKKFNIPVQIVNKPENLNIKVFPSEVGVSFLVALSDYESISTADFRIIAFYDSTQTTETLELVVDEKPGFIQQLRVTPPDVEYLIQTD